MASHVTALHHTTEFRFKAEFGDEIGLKKYLAWKHTWHTEVGKLPPSHKPKGPLEYKAWLKTAIEANPACQPDGTDKKEAWRKATIEASPSSQPDGSEEKEALARRDSIVPARRIGGEGGLAQSNDRGKSVVPAQRIGGEGGLAQKNAGRASEEKNGCSGRASRNHANGTHETGSHSYRRKQVRASRFEVQELW